MVDLSNIENRSYAHTQASHLPLKELRQIMQAKLIEEIEELKNKAAKADKQIKDWQALLETLTNRYNAATLELAEIESHLKQ